MPQENQVKVSLEKSYNNFSSDSAKNPWGWTINATVGEDGAKNSSLLEFLAKNQIPVGFRFYCASKEKADEEARKFIVRLKKAVEEWRQKDDAIAGWIGTEELTI